MKGERLRMKEGENSKAGSGKQRKKDRGIER